MTEITPQEIKLLQEENERLNRTVNYLRHESKEQNKIAVENFEAVKELSEWNEKLQSRIKELEQEVKHWQEFRSHAKRELGFQEETPFLDIWEQLVHWWRNPE